MGNRLTAAQKLTKHSKLTFDIICIDVVAAGDTRIVGERHSGVVEGEDVLNISTIIAS